jgi:hypothetical protein
VCDFTVDVATVKVAVVAPDATNTVTGVVTDFELLVILMVIPAAGAGPLRVTVTVDDCPPLTLEGFRVNSDSVAASTVKGAISDPDAVIATTWASILLATGTVDTLNVTEVDPAGTNTLEMTLTSGLTQANDTLKPPLGAGELILKVPVTPLPPVTTPALRVTLVRIGAVIESDFDAVVDPTEALIVAVASHDTGTVEISKFADSFPGGTVIDDGTEAASLEELSDTTTPAAPALAERITVPPDEVPPTTDAFAISTLDGDWAMAEAATDTNNKNETPRFRL